MNKQDTERLKKNKKDILFALDDCTGCTDPRSEGTHQMWSKQHFFEWYIEPYYTPQTTEGEEIKREAVKDFIKWVIEQYESIKLHAISIGDRRTELAVHLRIDFMEECLEKYLTQQGLDKGI